KKSTRGKNWSPMYLTYFAIGSDVVVPVVEHTGQWMEIVRNPGAFTEINPLHCEVKYVLFRMMYLLASMMEKEIGEEGVLDVYPNKVGKTFENLRDLSLEPHSEFERHESVGQLRKVATVLQDENPEIFQELCDHLVVDNQ